MQFCPSCAIEKSKIADINRKSTRDSDPSDPFHTVALDMWGPMSTPDLNGNRWALDASCYTTSSILYSLMKSKSDVNNSWKGFIITIKSLDFTIKR
jgi:hypothetical protein